MKIVHVIASLDPKNGGLQAVAMRIAAAQALLGLDVHIVSYASGAVRAKVLELGDRIPGFSRVHLDLLEEPDRVEMLGCLRGRRLLRKVLPSASFMHMHGVWEPFLFWASRQANAAGVAYCVCPAGMLDHWSLKQKSWKKKIGLGLCFRRMLNGAAFLHALNVDEIAAIQTLGLRTPNIIIPNGVFTEEFDPLPAKNRFREKRNLLPERRYVLFLSRLHFKKGLDILATAFAQTCQVFADVDLVVAGPDGGAERDFVSQIERLGIASRVHVIGPLYGDEKIEAMTDAFCFCLPSRQEGFSMAITEALACGTPVVISDQCHFPEVGDVAAGIIASLDPADVANALKTMLSDSQRASSMGQNGRRLVLEQFTWPKIALKTLESYGLRA